MARSTHLSTRLTLAALAAMIVGCGTSDGPDPIDTAATASDLELRPTLPAGAEAVSLLGETLLQPEISPTALDVYQARYREAQVEFALRPRDVDAIIWMGRRTAYLGRYREAIEIYTDGIALHPDDARLYRHRGHRYVSVREFDNAIVDFQKAAELTDGLPDQVEPDGLPNARGIPTSTLQFNIWYHLGLAHYLKGEFEAAAEAYEHCARVSEHDDSKVATAYWRYMTLSRLGRTDEATAVLRSVTEDMDVIESGGYLDLLLLFGGERTAEDILGPEDGATTLGGTTAGYGVGYWHQSNGRESEARAMYERTLAGRASQWAAFGYIAAEAELARNPS